MPGQDLSHKPIFCTRDHASAACMAAHHNGAMQCLMRTVQVIMGQVCWAQWLTSHACCQHADELRDLHVQDNIASGPEIGFRHMRKAQGTWGGE